MQNSRKRNMNSVECVWIGDDGELFRETVPSVTLTAAPDEAEEDEDEDADKGEDEERDEGETDRPDADEVKKAKRRKSA